MERKRIIIITVLAITVLIAYKLFANKSVLDKKKNPPAAAEVSIPVKIAEVKQQMLDINIIKTGTLAPFIEAKVLAPVSGTIKQLLFKLGDKVSQGEVIALLDSRLLELDLQKAVTSENKLKNDLETYTELLGGKATTREKYNEIRQNYLDAVNLTRQTRKQISDATIKAPTSGVIAVKNVEAGVFVNAGADIATVVNLSKAKVQVRLTENEVYQVKQGQTVKIRTDVYPDKTFTGTISFISPQADQTHNYMTEVMISNSDNEILRSGTFVYADFSRSTQQSLLVIPRDALTESIKNAAVYLVVNNHVKLQSVQTGREMGDLIEVTSGLKEGNVIVVSGQINLKDGALINVSK
jgi:membrane fusion protein (multidrug efflux system)